MSRRLAPLVLVLAIALLSYSAAPPDPSLKLEKSTSQFYTVYTNLAAEDARPFVEHMDATFAAYKKMFATFHPRQEGDFALYLLDTREHYDEFLASQEIMATHTGGIFFVNGRRRGLATFTRASKPGEHADRGWTFHTLQHEGFHQFAFTYIGPNLPLWVNEGLAEYFGNGVLVNGQLLLGSSPAVAIDAVRSAIRSNTAIDFDKLIAMTSPQWFKAMSDRSDGGALLYQQSWSIVHFLIHGDGGKYTQAFEKYLHSLAEGRDSTAAFHDAFGTNDTASFRARWEAYIQQLKPDPLSTAVANLQFLGMGIQALAPILAQQHIPQPRTFDELKRMLKQGHFSVTRSMHSQVTRLTANDDTLFEYTLPNSQHADFKLLQPAPNSLPGLTAPGMSPVPTLQWRRESDNQLVADIQFKSRD